MDTTPNLQALRMRYAFDAVNDWSATMRKESVQRVKGLPVELRTQGLVVTIATLVTQGPYAHLAETLARWLLTDAPVRPLQPWTRDQGRVARCLMAACTRADRSAYLAAQAEALALAEHIKRFACALEEA